jgi:hypothetical protein
MNLRIAPYRSTTVLNAVRRALAFTLIFAIGPVAPLLAQVSAITPSPAGAPKALFITILDGEDAVNSIRERTAREPIVQVEDENHKPVAGALVLFSVHGGASGAGGSFNGLSSLSVTTDSAGRATGHGLIPNSTKGKYTISVSVTVGAMVATAIITQKNATTAGNGSSSAKRISKFNVYRTPIIIGVVGVVVITVAVRTTTLGGRNSTTITAGGGTVGPP